MEAFLVPAQTVDEEGNRLATVFWPVLAHAPPPGILAVALRVEDLPLAISMARHWGCFTRERTGQGLLLLELNGAALPIEVEQALANQQTVIVVRSLTADNLAAVNRAKNKLEELSGKKVEVGALTDELGKHAGLVVRIPANE
jgi:hypothetical protein